jgi:hypothetical protein
MCRLLSVVAACIGIRGTNRAVLASGFFSPLTYHTTAPTRYCAPYAPRRVSASLHHIYSACCVFKSLSIDSRQADYPHHRTLANTFRPCVSQVPLRRSCSMVSSWRLRWRFPRTPISIADCNRTYGTRLLSHARLQDVNICNNVFGRRVQPKGTGVRYFY